MPATYTHAVYGEKVLSVLDESLKGLIQKYRGLYDIGLSGPDILFFHKPFTSNEIRTLGNQMHEVPAREFFMRARTVILKSKNPEASLVYILGFINHFVLDSECHPIVNKTVRESEVSHAELESELDAMLMRKNGLDPIRTRVGEHIHCNKDYAEIIAPFFEVDSSSVIESLKTMKLILNACVAPQEWKRKLVFWIMKKVGAYDHYHGLVFNREAREDTKKVVEELVHHFDDVVSVSVSLIEEYKSSLMTASVLDKRYDRNYE